MVLAKTLATRRTALLIPALIAIFALAYVAHLRFAVQDRSGYLWLAGAGAILALVAPPLMAARYEAAHALNLASARRRWIGVGLLVVGAILLLDAARLFYTQLTTNQFTGSDHWIRYAAGLGMSVVGGILLTRGVQPHRVRVRSLLLGLIVLVAVFLRIYALDSMPPGIWYDEAVSGLEARRMLDETTYRPIFTNNMTLPHLGAFAVSMQIYGKTSIYGPRLVMALLGSASVVVGYLVGAQLRGHFFGLLMALVLATMHWSINFSRIAMTGVEPTLFILLVFYFAVRLVRYGQARDALYAGLAVGAGIWFYRAFQPLLVAVAVYLAVSWSYRQRSWKNTLTLALTAAASTLAVILPVVIFALTRSEYFERVGEVSIFSPNFKDMPVNQALAFNVQRHLEMFHILGDRNGRHNLPGEPMLDPVTGILFGLGLAVAVRGWRRGETVFFLLVLLLGLTGGIVTVTFEAPQSLRSIGVLSAVAYFTALGSLALGQTLWAVVEPITAMPELAVQAAPAAAVLGVGIALAWLNYDVYFLRQRSDYDVWREYSTAETLVGRILAEQDDNTLLLASPFIGKHPSMQFVAPAQTDRVEVLDMPDFLPLRLPPTHKAIIFLVPIERMLFEYAQKLYPNGHFRIVSSQDSGIPGSDAFYVIELSSDDIASIQGLESDGSGILDAPYYGDYQFIIPEGSTLTLDGQRYTQPDISVKLARGVHEIALDPPDAALQWMPPTSNGFEPAPDWTLFHAPVEARGLLARYYANGDWAGEPVMERIHPFVYQQIHILPLPRPYSVIWSGQLYAPETGAYQFSLLAIDYGRLSLDGNLVIETTEPNARFFQTVELTSGWHTIEVRHQDLTNSTRIFLEWTPPGSNGFVPVPMENLRPE